MIIKSASSKIIVTTEIVAALEKVLKEIEYDNLYILVDENSFKHCYPVFQSLPLLEKGQIIKISSGEVNKSVKSLEQIWSYLSENGGTRSSLLINIGGGVLCDMGGFAASTFKRGIRFINIPTTLLSQVDASMGGKTGINFLNYKNEIGLFSHPEFVLINSEFLKTLENRHILAGWAEMIKHALIFSEDDYHSLSKERIQSLSFDSFNKLITRSVNIKKHFVEKDPNEKNIRKALNFGHTIGHAFESFFMHRKTKLLHGEAVAHGIVCELYLSAKKSDLAKSMVDQISKYILDLYGKVELLPINDEEYINLMLHDKKNKGNEINFTLLSKVGESKIDQIVNIDEIKSSFEYYRSL